MNHSLLQIQDIHKRLRELSRLSNRVGTVESTIVRENVNIALSSGSPKMIMKSIENACKSNPIQFESVLKLFDALYECESSTSGQLTKMCSYICEEAVPKVRDAKDTNTNLRRKLGRMKSKVSTKIDNNIQDAMATVNAKIHAAQNNFKKNTAQIKANVNKGLRRPMATKQESYIECYEQFAESTLKVEEADRIIENYNTFSKRFNLEKLFVENTRINGVKDTIHKLCGYEDTYQIKDMAKFALVIESGWFGLEQIGYEYDKKELLEAATDYFLMKPNGYKDCKYVLENSTIYDPEDMPSDMEVFTEKDPVEDEEPNVFKQYEEIQNQISESSSSIILEEYNFNKIFSDFKKSDTENKESKLSMLVRKLYAKNVSNIVDETPNFLNWIRRIFVLGTVAINPVLGAIAIIGDIFAQLHFEREETEKMMKCFDKEIAESEAKMKSSNDAEEKKRLKAYINSLKNVRNKIDMYYERMLTDKELDAKYDNDNTDIDSFDDIKTTITSKDDGDEDDFDFDDWGDDDDDDFDFDDDSFSEAAVDTINFIKDVVDNIEEYDDKIDIQTVSNIDMFNAEDMDDLAKLSVNYPDIWAPELMETAIYNKINRIRKGKLVFENTLERFKMLDACDQAIKILNTEKAFKPSNIGEAVRYVNCLNESIEAINAIIYAHKNKSVMVEASFVNSLKLASEKLKKGLTKLSDKDKQISNKVDVSLSQLKKSMENTLTNENREAVIKGSVLPSASKIIKLGITTGALWLINPVIAVINALGYLALSAKHKAKERQLILDELDVELKMCRKYMDIAESKNDMKALKQLMTIEKTLTRQEQRIRYKMKVDFNQNAPKSNDD